MSKTNNKLHILIVDDDLTVWPPIFTEKISEQYKAISDEQYELEIETVVPDSTNTARTKFLDSARELIETGDIDFVILDWNLGDFGEYVPHAEKVFSEPLVRLCIDLKIPFRLCSGSGDSFREFTGRMVLEDPNFMDLVIDKRNPGSEDEMDQKVRVMIQEGIEHKKSHENFQEDPLNKV